MSCVGVFDTYGQNCMGLDRKPRGSFDTFRILGGGDTCTRLGEITALMRRQWLVSLHKEVIT